MGMPYVLSWMRRQDVLCLQETCSTLADPLHGLLGDTHVPYVAAGLVQGRKGQGVAVYIKHALLAGARVRVVDAHCRFAAVTVWAHGRLLMVLTAYLSPSCSSAAMRAFYDAVGSILDDAHAGGAQVVLAGDFNAHVGDVDDRPVGVDGRVAPGFTSRLPDTASTVNPSGRELCDLCVSHGMLLSTGRFADCAGPSFVKPPHRTRPDHMLVSLPLVSFVRDLFIDEDYHWETNEHLPLQLTLLLPPAAPSPAAVSPDATILQCLKRIVWDASKMEAYVAAFQSNPTVLRSLQEFDQAVANGSSEAAVKALHAALWCALCVAGMRVSSYPARATPRRKHQPWFDAECRAAYVSLHGRRYMQPSAVRDLRALLRRKKRQYASVVWDRYTAAAYQNPGAFWRLVRHRRKDPLLGAPSVDEFTAHFESFFDGEGMPYSPASGPPPTDDEVASVVNPQTLLAAVQQLKSSASPGEPGIPSQAFAVAPVLDRLLGLLQLVYQQGVEPPSMQTAVLRPLFKKRDRGVTANYRPIVVSAVLHKIFALCILQFATAHYSARPAVHARQAGFQQARSTLHNAFALMHFVHRHRHNRQPLYWVMVDVNKAYDSVVHWRILDVLHSHDMPPHVVRAIAGCYAGLQYRVVGEQGLGAPFHVRRGVKQGCPLSPCLFNAYIADLSVHVTSQCPGDGPVLQVAPFALGHHPDFTYADDICLLALDPVGLQRLLTATGSFLHTRQLHMEPDKMSCMVFGSPRIRGEVPPPQLQVHGEAVPLANPHGEVYLGMCFDSDANPTTMAAHRAKCFATSFAGCAAALQAAYTRVPYSVPHLLTLLHMVAMPAGLYGCELWGPLLLYPSTATTACADTCLYALTDPLELQRCKALRQRFRLPVAVPKLCLLHELGLAPLSHTYIVRAVRFYNRLLADTGRPSPAAPSPYRQALAMDVEWGLRGTYTWAYALSRLLLLLLPRGNVVAKMRRGQALPVGEVKRALKHAYTQHVARLTGETSGVGSWTRYYFRCVGLHPLGRQPAYLSLRATYWSVQRCLRFRLGCHYLRVNVGRWVNLPRPQRLCVRCPSGEVDDEDHCLFRCTYARLQHLRQHFWDRLSMNGAPTPAAAQRPMSFRALWDRYAGNESGLHATLCFVAAAYDVAHKFHLDGPDQPHWGGDATAHADHAADMFLYFDSDVYSGAAGHDTFTMEEWDFGAGSPASDV